jgi:hypothetical protein
LACKARIAGITYGAATADSAWRAQVDQENGSRETATKEYNRARQDTDGLPARGPVFRRRNLRVGHCRLCVHIAGSARRMPAVHLFTGVRPLNRAITALLPDSLPFYIRQQQPNNISVPNHRTHRQRACDCCQRGNSWSGRCQSPADGQSRPEHAADPAARAYPNSVITTGGRSRVQPEPFPARAKDSGLFTLVFYGVKDFSRKTAQFCARRREPDMSGCLASATVCNELKTCAKTLS